MTGPTRMVFLSLAAAGMTLGAVDGHCAAPPVAGPRAGALLRKAAEAAAGIAAPHERAAILAYIGQAHHKAGDKAAADRILKQALETASKIEEDTPLYMALSALTTVEVQRGNVAAALKACELMENVNRRAGLILGVVREQAAGGDPDGARKTAEGLNGDTQAQALTAVAYARARALARTGDAAGARKEAAGLDPWQQYSVLTDIASAHARAKEAAKAKAVLAEARRKWFVEMEKIIPPSTRARFLVDHALARAECGDVAGALETFAESKFEEDKGDHGSKGYYYWRLAVACVKAGDAKAAVRFAEGIKDERDRLVTLTEAARAQAEAKDKAGARETLARARKLEAGLPADPRYGSPSAQVEALLGDAKAALAAARAAKKGTARGMALLGVGRGLAASGHGAAEAFAEAAAELAGGDAFARVRLPGALAGLAEAGEPARALAMADKEKDPTTRARCLLGIVHGMTEAAKRGPKKP